MEPIRKTVRLKKPNPLFEAWLEEWIEEARKIRSDAQHQFEKALGSLRKYPILLSSGKECLILEHFDPALCIRLDRKLSEHKKTLSSSQSSASPPKEVKRKHVTQKNLQTSRGKENGSTDSDNSNAIPKLVKKRKTTKNPSIPQEECTSVETTKNPQGKSYEPKYRSAAFALLVTLLNSESLPGFKGMGKADLQREAQVFCDASFTQAARGGFYTAWSTMSQLVSKQLVKKGGHPIRFSLTDSGRDLAVKLLSLYPSAVNDAPTRPAVVSSISSSDVLAPSKRSKKKMDEQKADDYFDDGGDEAQEVPDYFLPNTFDIILLVDTAETIGAQKKSQDETIRELTRRSVMFEVRHLKVGDFLWVAKDRLTGIELVLPYIVERKRMDDLSRSIKDGRFHEQKFRLKQCGLANLIYLIENKGGSEHHGLPLSSLFQAATNTEVVDKFSVKITSGHSDSVMYLSFLTKIFTDLFKSKTLFVCEKEYLPDEYNLEDYVVSLCTFQNFCRNVGKTRNFSVKEMFIKQLIQLHGLSPDKAWAVVELYPSPLSLMSAFEEVGDSLLTSVTYGELNRKIGPVISKTLHSFYTQESFLS